MVFSSFSTVRRGLTYVELVLIVFVLALATLAVYAGYTSLRSTWAEQDTRSELLSVNSATWAATTLSSQPFYTDQALKNATSVGAASADSSGVPHPELANLQLLDPDQSSTKPSQVSAYISPDNRSLTLTSRAANGTCVRLSAADGRVVDVTYTVTPHCSVF